MSNEAIKTLLSTSFQKRLDQTLILCDRAIFPRDIVASHTRMRTLLELVYPYCRIALFPDSVLVDLGESLQDIYLNRANLKAETKHIEEYLISCRSAHRRKQTYHDRQTHLDVLSARKPSLERLDNTFSAWLYNTGYYAQQDKMYKLLQETLYDVTKYLTHE